MLIIYKFCFKRYPDIEVKALRPDFKLAMKEVRESTTEAPTSVIRTTFHNSINLDKVTEAFCKDNEMNKDELCYLYGLKGYDVALPQDWLDDMSREMAYHCEISCSDAYDKLRTSTVWHYPDGFSLIGKPFYLTEEIQTLINKTEKQL